MLSDSSTPQAAARPYPTRALARRNREGSPEQRAHDRLIAALASDEPHRLQRCVEVIRDYFHADSAGLHIVPSAAVQSAGALDVVCGLFESHDPAQTRLGSGLAKLCFAARTPIVMCQQEIELTYLRHLRPRIVHILMTPIYDDHQQPLGAIWLAQADSALTYSRADTLILERMSQDLALGLKVHEREQEQAALASRLETRCAQLEEQLHAERLRREAAEANALGANRAASYETTLLREAHHRVQNTLQVSSIGMRTPSLDTHFGLTWVRSLANRLGRALTFANSLDPPGTLVTHIIPDREQRILPELALSPSKHIETTTAEVTS